MSRPDDLGSFKLFCGQLPKTMNEDDLRAMFSEFGDVVEVAIIKERKTGQSKGCCFVRYATRRSADACIEALHEKRTMPPATHPIQVRYAEGELEKLESKLFVGMLPKDTSQEELENMFSIYGKVVESAIMKDKQTHKSKGCAFVKFETRGEATAAIESLNGKKLDSHVGKQALNVKFADTERDKMQKAHVFQAVQHAYPPMPPMPMQQYGAWGQFYPEPFRPEPFSAEQMFPIQQREEAHDEGSDNRPLPEANQHPPKKMKTDNHSSSTKDRAWLARKLQESNELFHDGLINEQERDRMRREATAEWAKSE
jgi:CUG-BP- and ETR3-like factor